jgi:hypothetical protein
MIVTAKATLPPKDPRNAMSNIAQAHPQKIKTYAPLIPACCRELG